MPEGEVWKTIERRKREGWFDKYCPEDRSGIDIGCQRDPINQTFRRWDLIFGDGDATFMDGVPNDTFFTVHASHILEHLTDPVTGIKNWYRILKPGGHLIILVPHRDLYEKKKVPPSNWNFDHKTFWLPDSSDHPKTKSLKHVIYEAIPNANIVSFGILDYGYDYSLPIHIHACGEYSIEAIIRKPE